MNGKRKFSQWFDGFQSGSRSTVCPSSTLSVVEWDYERLGITVIEQTKKVDQQYKLVIILANYCKPVIGSSLVRGDK